jgi:F0F1-type ATP synthase membrane subunit c/vacuolar-type H+-ATPase subunit K
MRDHTSDSSSQALKAIYSALAFGVFLFAAIVLFVIDPLEATIAPNVMRIVWLGVAVVATLGTGVIRGRMASTSAGPDHRRASAIIVWALAEGQALVGIVGTLLTGDRVTTYASLALFVWLWMRYPPGSFSGR